MAHCGSCKSNIKPGTGGLYLPQGMVAKTGRATARTGATTMTSIALAENGTRLPLVLKSGRINKQFWVPATSIDVDPGLATWAYFPGGQRARLHINGVEQKRRVLGHKNGGATGLLVRLGEIIKEFGSGGCGDLTGLPGTGGEPIEVQSIQYGGGSKALAANRWFKASYFEQPAGHPKSWVKLSGAVPGQAELWMHGAGPVHSHEVEIIGLKGKNSTLQALVAGWSLPYMASGAVKGTGGRRTTVRQITTSQQVGTGGYYAAGTSGAQKQLPVTSMYTLGDAFAVVTPKYLTL